MMPLILWAQAPDPAFSGFNSSGGASSTQFIIRIVVCVVAIAAAFAVSYFYVFPRLLQKPDPDWPRTAFGKACGLFWLLAWIAAAICFWPELKLPSEGEIGPPMSLIYEYGLRVGLVVGAILGGLVVAYIYRSEREKATA